MVVAVTAQSTSARRQTLWILWAGFLSAIFVYGVVVMTISTGAQEAAPGAVRLPFLLVALLLAGASIWWKRRSTGETQFMPATGKQQPSFDQFQTSCLVTWALSEAVGVIGLLLGILTRDPGAFLPFGASAVLLLVIHRPNTWPQWPTA
jgi:F0F1-type ATP synthase membrane subunit c/vacuolar-type H+-ATPase subunit K